MSEELRRIDDAKLATLTNEIDILKEEILQIKNIQTSVVIAIDAEKQDHLQIRENIKNFDSKLILINSLLEQINGDKDVRSKLMEDISERVKDLQKCIKETNINIKDHVSAPIHKWASTKMEQEAEIQKIKKKVYESLLTRAANVIFFGLVGLLFFGIWEYLKTLP